MKLTAPIYRLKRRARDFARKNKIPLHEALNSIAAGEGYPSWSLLASQASNRQPSRQIHDRLSPGDLLLLAARPGHGKTTLALEIAIEAIRSGGRSAFYTLDFKASDVADIAASIGVALESYADSFLFDDSDEISADYLIARLGGAPRGTVAVIDYLQLLDQKRSKPELMTQVRALRSFASEKGVVLVFVSQIDRTYDASSKRCPGFDDVRLPNPLDLSLFNKGCFLNDGALDFCSRQ